VWDKSKNKSPDELELLTKTCRQQAMDRARRHAKPNIDLAAIHDIIRLHGGSIEVHTGEGGVGTSCLVSLPVKRSKSIRQRGASRAQ
jgi:signal transduction histidine kinase